MPDNHFPEVLDIFDFFTKKVFLMFSEKNVPPGLPAHPRAQLTLNLNQIAIEKARQGHAPHARQSFPRGFGHF